MVVRVKVDSKVYDKPEMLMDIFRINQMVDTFWDEAISHKGGSVDVDGEIIDNHYLIYVNNLIL